MVITILEAHIKAENRAAFQDDYKNRTAQLPAQMLQTFLLQDTADGTLWRIVSVWKNREALNEMRNSGETPTGVLMLIVVSYWAFVWWRLNRQSSPAKR